MSSSDTREVYAPGAARRRGPNATSRVVARQVPHVRLSKFTAYSCAVSLRGGCAWSSATYRSCIEETPKTDSGSSVCCAFVQADHASYPANAHGRQVLLSSDGRVCLRALCTVLTLTLASEIALRRMAQAQYAESVTGAPCSRLPLGPRTSDLSHPFSRLRAVHCGQHAENDMQPRPGRRR